MFLALSRGNLSRSILAAGISLLAVIVIAMMARSSVIDGLTRATHQLLDGGITDFVFDDERGRPLDDQSIRYFMEQVNTQLAIPRPTFWLSPWEHRGSVLKSIGDVSAGDAQSDEGVVHATSIFRGGRDRPVQIVSYLSPRWSALVIWAGFFLTLSLLVVRLIPAPLSQCQTGWLAYLRRIHGWPSSQAFAFIREHLSDQNCQAATLDRVDRLVSGAGLEVAESVRLLADPTVGGLSPTQFDWFALGVTQSGGDPAVGLRVALADNVIEIAPRRKQLSVHGLDVEIDHASLTVLAWYAQRRKRSDGWINSPPANLTQKSQLVGEDKTNAEELLALFEAADVHGRSIDSIEKGVTAKFLSSHRSKIRAAIKAALRGNEQLLESFDFEEQPIAGTDRRRYRLRVSPNQLLIDL